MVRSSPAVVTTISMNGIPRGSCGLSWVKLEPGTYEVSFSDVPGFATPDPVCVEVKEGQFTTVNGDFTKLGVTKVVASPPSAATSYINGAVRDSWGTWAWLRERRYEVTFGAVPGHEPLPSQTVLVVPGQTTLVVGQY